VRVGVLGAGYVGLTTAACLCSLGHTAVCADIDDRKIAALREGQDPLGEPGMEELLAAGLRQGTLSFAADPAAVRGCEVVFICVGTPAGPDGGVDVSAVEDVTRRLPPILRGGETVVVKSTVPVGTGDWVEAELRALCGRPVPVVSNPEFLREGSAVQDFFRPDRIVVGAGDAAAGDLVLSLYQGVEAPRVSTGRRAAELIKYAANAFLTVKISFANELAGLCEGLGIDYPGEVERGVGLDRGVGLEFLAAGAGYGGPCLPKDAAGLLWMAGRAGVPLSLVAAAQEVNRDQRRRLVDRLEEMLGGLKGRRVAVWGLAFKPNTGDLRDAPSLDIVRLCLARGALVTAYDPAAMAEAAAALPGVEMAPDRWAAVEGADGLLIVTEWAEFHRTDPRRLAQSLRGRVVLDGRNVLDPAAAAAAGLCYAGVGRGEGGDAP